MKQPKLNYNKECLVHKDYSYYETYQLGNNIVHKVPILPKGLGHWLNKDCHCFPVLAADGTYIHNVVLTEKEANA